MTIDPKTIPDDTVIEYTNETGAYNLVGVTPFTLGHTEHVVRVFVPVPDGVAYDDALRAVNDLEPTDPDAERVDALAKAMHDSDDTEDKCAYGYYARCAMRDRYMEAARAALAVIREDQP